MRLIIPIRGSDGLDFLDKEYKKFLKDINSFGNNSDLISLLGNEEKYRNIQSMDFLYIYSSEFYQKENEEIKHLGNKYSKFKTKYIHDYLDIKIIFKRNYVETIGASILVESIIQKLALLINLSYTTKVDFLDGLIFENETYLGKTPILLNALDFSYEHAIKNNWPEIKKISLKKTVEWFTIQKLHTDGNSKNKLQRAINAFSYLFSNLHEKDSSNLFWVMLGIEALLGEGSNNIINQIKIKTSLILGEPTEYKKKLDKLYNYRSRLVHGDYDFPAKFSSDYDIFEDEYWDYLAFATSILLALIRNLINQGKSEFKFEYRLIK